MMPRNLVPGFCIVQQAGQLHFQASMLFRDANSPAARLFMHHNADTPWLIPGQVMIVTDPNTPLTPSLLQCLQQTKRQINQRFIGFTPDEAGFLHRHYGTIAALTAAGDKIFSTTGDAGERYFSAIKSTLGKIETAYQTQYRAQGTLNNERFFAERRRLPEELKTMVNKPLLKSLSRQALDLSSRSIVHQ
ncbi:hypothetical protein PT300_04930 [Enterobacteriaceae bacterium ESL0689]|nr:hypothetical protein [Enterobacteriaceae bacterium ESL0689]